MVNVDLCFFQPQDFGPSASSQHQHTEGGNGPRVGSLLEQYLEGITQRTVLFRQQSPLPLSVGDTLYSADWVIFPKPQLYRIAHDGTQEANSPVCGSFAASDPGHASRACPDSRFRLPKPNRVLECLYVIFCDVANAFPTKKRGYMPVNSSTINFERAMLLRASAISDFPQISIGHVIGTKLLEANALSACGDPFPLFGFHRVFTGGHLTQVAAGFFPRLVHCQGTIFPQS